MHRKYYAAEFRTQAVRLVIEAHLPVQEVAILLGMPVEPLYAWVRRYRAERSQTVEFQQLQKELLQKELQNARHERDVLTSLATKLLDEKGHSTGSLITVTSDEEQHGREMLATPRSPHSDNK